MRSTENNTCNRIADMESRRQYRKGARGLGSAVDAGRRFASAGCLAGVGYTNHTNCELAVSGVEYDQQSSRMSVAMMMVSSGSSFGPYSLAVLPQQVCVVCVQGHWAMLSCRVLTPTGYREDVSTRLVRSQELRSRRGNQERSSYRVEQRHVFFR
jgi:hypothetical protein